jgi:hypothetical protein
MLLYFKFFRIFRLKYPLYSLLYVNLYFSTNPGTEQMSTELATIDLSQLPSTQLGSDEAFADLAKGGDYLRYIKLCSGDKFVKKKLIEDGHFGIPRAKEVIDDLGDSIDIIPLARRPKAVDLSDLSAIVTSYDETSTVFQDIKERAKGTDSGCQYGISYLVLERSTGGFYEFFFGTSSSRPEAKNVAAYMQLTQAQIDAAAANGHDVIGIEPHGPLPVTLKADFRENKKGMWYTPMAVKCSTPFRTGPAPAAIVKEVTRFLTIKSEGTEKVKDERKARAR